jgi:RNA polymerase sigma-70 factor (ECF subfamily)
VGVTGRTEPFDPDRSPLSFEGFYELHYRPVLGLAVVLSGNRQVAEEVTQEAFLAAYRDWGRVGKLEHAPAWVRRVVANKAASRFRRLAAESRALVRLGGDEQTEGDPLDAVISDQVWEAVRRLPRRQARVVALTYLDGLSRREVAEVLDCSDETVKTHLERGRARLARVLADADNEDGS